METALRRMGEMIEATTVAVREWFAAGGAIELSDPATWPLGLWLLLLAFVALLFAATLRRRSRGPLDVRPPEILITQGELVPEPRLGRLGSGVLTMTVSNLGRYPVQVLEAASRSGGGRFGVAEAVVLVPAMGEVDVEVQLPVGKLEDGVLDVFCYAAATRTKTWRHRAELVWEPWGKRFKVAPLEQRIEPAKALASARRDVVRMDDVRKALEAAERQAATAAGHAEAKRSEITPRVVEAVGPRRAPARDDARRSASARPTDPGVRAADDASRGPLAALLGSKRAPVVGPPPPPNGGGAGASARAARAPRRDVAADRPPSTPSAGTGADPTAPSATPASVTSTAGGTPREQRAPVHLVPPEGRRPAPERRAPTVDEPEADAAPKRPRDRVLEFPEDF